MATAKIDQKLFLKEDFLLSEENDLSSKLEISPRETFIVFDWDDTILPTSWLVKNKISLETPFIPSQKTSELQDLDSVACNLLRRAAFLYGQVLIITNAQQGWVELSSKKFLPETHELLFSSDADSDMSSQHSYSSSSSDFRPKLGEKRTWEGNSKSRSMVEDIENDTNNEISGKIQVFSARHLFEKENPLDPSAWKKHAFQKLLRSRISSQFFRSKAKGAESCKRIKSLSVSVPESNESESESNSNSPQKLKLERRNSDLSGLDLSELVELEAESYEIEEDLCDRASFFSVDFSVDPNETEKLFDEFEFESFPEFQTNSKSAVVAKRPCCNLLSLGDCFHDRDSLRDLDLDLKDTIKKTVKLMEFPSITQLQAQLVSIDNYLNKIIYLAKDVDLEINKKLFIS